MISQIGLALPTLGLYEISILCVRLVERRRERAAQDAEGDEDDGPAEQPSA